MLSMDETYRAHAQTVYRYLLSLTHDAALSEELTQDTFYQAVKSVNRFDGSCKVSTWLCAIAKTAVACRPAQAPAGRAARRNPVRTVGRAGRAGRVLPRGAAAAAARAG